MEVERSIGEIAKGMVPQRKLQKKVTELKNVIRERDDAEMLMKKLGEAVKKAAREEAKGFRKDMKNWKQQQQEQDEQDELEILNAANRRLNNAIEQQGDSLSLITASSEALTAVQKEYTSVVSYLGSTRKILSRLWAKHDFDNNLLRFCFFYFLLVSGYIVASRIFGGIFF
eukprot:TRINITY_DN20962_c0_g1_i1.p1 TRINITY_DN20962_c0_g1~~TRINITY_DN20962_c0_g1_i1.p1  ORF type:complete len:192 (+),score=51.62 TRINITY_DN20962_c0_g1_i1:65-577(+)